MNSVARVVVPGLPDHVTQRGNQQTDVFLDDRDREAYLCLLGKYAAQHGLSDSGVLSHEGEECVVCPVFPRKS